MIEGKQNWIYKLISKQQVGEMRFEAGQEFNIINQVVYMEGFPLPLPLQGGMLNWINNNKKLFNIIDRPF